MREELISHFELIDESLALDAIPVSERPFEATWFFVRNFVIEACDSLEGPKPPGKLSEYMGSRWFQALYSEVEEWYRMRYGDRLDQRTNKSMKGVTLVASTPFELQVPTTTVRTGNPGETVWLSFPDAMLDEDDVVAWFVNPPNLNHYSDEAQIVARKTATAVASRLRAISCSKKGANVTDDITKGFLSGVTVHLESACSLILQEDGESFARAQWELQMACESVYKGLLQQQMGGFPETHDLFVLHDRALPYLANVSRELIHKLPRWREASDLRYGQGDQATVFGIFEWYKTTLTIVSEVLSNLKGIKLANTRIEIRKAPWLGNIS